MAQATLSGYEQYSDDALMHRHIELYEHAEEHADELATIDTIVQSRLLATYGAAPPGAAPRICIAA